MSYIRTMNRQEIKLVRHVKRALTRYNIIVLIQLSVYYVTCNVGTYNVVDTNVISVLFYYVMIVIMRIPACLRI